MTRETKIGLLVGLAFIIVIGILLSDHLTSSTEPPQASLGQVGNNVRQTTVSPGATAPPITAVVPPQVQPQQQVMTQQEANRPQPVQVIKVGPANVQPAQPHPPTVIAIQPPVPIAQENPASPSNDIPITKVPEVKGTIGEIASQMGEPLVGLGQQNETVAEHKEKSVIVATSVGKQYKAEEGDSVSSMARKFLGGNTLANREAIVKANPSLQQNPDRIFVGRTYLIPNIESISTAPAPVVVEKTTPITPSEAGGTSASTDNWYVVKPGDNLSKIAVMQCGTAGAVTAIKDLNKDSLKDSDVIQVGMKLRLPSKPLASAE